MYKQLHLPRDTTNKFILLNSLLGTTFFFTNTPDAFTQLGAALHFYGVALRYAPTPQAKGKIERRHDYWQKRLPPLLAADSIHCIEPANALLDALITHANRTEVHREIGSTPHAGDHGPTGSGAVGQAAS